MKVASARDWSVGLNNVSLDSLPHAKLLSELGRGLRKVYGEVDAQPVPEHFAVFIERLEERECVGSRDG